jgi:hypothetical protein
MMRMTLGAIFPVLSRDRDEYRTPYGQLLHTEWHRPREEWQYTGEALRRRNCPVCCSSALMIVLLRVIASYCLWCTTDYLEAVVVFCSSRPTAWHATHRPNAYPASDQRETQRGEHTGRKHTFADHAVEVAGSSRLNDTPQLGLINRGKAMGVCNIELEQ